MNTNCYKDIWSLAAVVDRTYRESNASFPVVSVIGKYTAISKIFWSLCCREYFPSFVQLSDEDWDGYKDEFILSLYEGNVTVEKMKHGDTYYSTEADVIFIMDDCNSRVISKCESENIIFVSIGEDDEYDSKAKKECSKDQSCTKVNFESLFYSIEDALDDLRELFWRL